QVELQRRLPQEQPVKSAAYEQRYKAQSKQHGAVELDLAAPERSQPIEGHDRRGPADRHCEYGKCERRVWAHPADKHVVAPDAEAEETDSANRGDHHAVSKYRFARKRGEQMRHHAHPGKNGDVRLRTAKEPEQVLP